jgi:hypothetical protein
MARIDVASRKQVRRPAGCESHLTRRQAAAVLGFASEFKVRELERQGLLRSVRGPMRTAFYARPDVLALKARLAQISDQPETEWMDADLIALLEHPGPSGQVRTVVDLVREARISIERAERVYAFWSNSAGAGPASAGASAPAAATEAHPLAPARDVARAKPGSERRSEERRSRDSLIRELRDPDPRVRQRAFEHLRAGRLSSLD